MRPAPIVSLFEGTAFVEGQVEFSVFPLVDEDAGVGIPDAALVGRLRGGALIDEVFPGEQVVPGVVAHDVVIGVAGALAVFEAL